MPGYGSSVQSSSFCETEAARETALACGRTHRWRSPSLKAARDRQWRSGSAGGAPVSRLFAAPRVVAALTAASLLASCHSTAPLLAMRVHTLELRTHDKVIVVTHAPRELGMHDTDLEHWVANAATAVQTYYGRFPVQQVRVDIEPTEGHGPQTGAAFGFGSPLIRMNVGRGSGAADLAQDWMLTHEMVHLAFPRVPIQHHWIEEGLATYVEPIARAQAGQLSTKAVWRELVLQLPEGLPRSGDHGLDFTPTWGRTYWGGALFCLLADVEIRKRTGDRYGLQDALRGILDDGGNIQAIWPLDRALARGDAAVGVPVLTELYEQLRATPVDIDLDALWVQLGVNVVDGDVTFDETAPLAHIRRAITSRRTNS
jgi:hypothetical protein